MLKMRFLLIAFIIVSGIVAAFQFHTSYVLPIERGLGNNYFSFIMLPDTQGYSEAYPELFEIQTQWILDNKDTLNVKFISHLGDIVESGAERDEEWLIASRSMRLLEGVIPYGILPGNHDIDDVNNPLSAFTQYNTVFPVARFTHFPWFGGSFNSYENNYQLISVDSVDFIFLNLAIDPSDEVLAWGNQILKQYKDRKAIVTTHAYLYDDLDMRSDRSYFKKDGNSGENIWNKLIKNNCSVFLVLSGHYHSTDGENYILSQNECGKNVHQTVQDYQERDKGGNGWLRIYKYYPEKSVVLVQTYSPFLDAYEKDKDSEFILEIN
ncbi:MAG: metallophosphoesterase [Candidatus Roizmanbacteria bacterium]|nr:metallophosphoesterase [Candidatus Roizmanbacteria bacterium]